MVAIVAAVPKVLKSRLVTAEEALIELIAVTVPSGTNTAAEQIPVSARQKADAAIITFNTFIILAPLWVDWSRDIHRHLFS
jgi:hypothetical protein